MNIYFENFISQFTIENSNYNIRKEISNILLYNILNQIEEDINNLSIETYYFDVTGINYFSIVKNNILNNVSYNFDDTLFTKLEKNIIMSYIKIIERNYKDEVKNICYKNNVANILKNDIDTYVKITLSNYKRIRLYIQYLLISYLEKWMYSYTLQISSNQTENKLGKSYFDTLDKVTLQISNLNRISSKYNIIAYSYQTNPLDYIKDFMTKLDSYYILKEKIPLDLLELLEYSDTFCIQMDRITVPTNFKNIN